MARLNAIPGYLALFARAKDPVTSENWAVSPGMGTPMLSNIRRSTTTQRECARMCTLKCSVFRRMFRSAQGSPGVATSLSRGTCNDTEAVSKKGLKSDFGIPYSFAHTDADRVR